MCYWREVKIGISCNSLPFWRHGMRRVGRDPAGSSFSCSHSPKSHPGSGVLTLLELWQPLGEGSLQDLALPWSQRSLSALSPFSILVSLLWTLSTPSVQVRKDFPTHRAQSQPRSPSATSKLFPCTPPRCKNSSLAPPFLSQNSPPSAAPHTHPPSPSLLWPLSLPGAVFFHILPGLNLHPAHLFEFQSGLHRGPVLHLLGQPSVPGAGQLLLLHGGPDIHRHRLFVLQHVSEASRSNKTGFN